MSWRRSRTFLPFLSCYDVNLLCNAQWVGRFSVPMTQLCTGLGANSSLLLKSRVISGRCFNLLLQRCLFSKHIHKMGEPPSPETESDQQLLSFDDYDAFGFDLDHTLAHYNLPNLFNTIYDGLAKYLVEEKGYDKSLLRPFDLDKDFCTRGLVLEIENGNFLKLAQDGTILRASHGTRFLSDKEITDVYGEKRHWGHFDKLIAKVDNPEGDRIFENFYDMPGCLVAARVIDLIDKQNKTPPEKYNFWPDMVATFTDVYRQPAFSENTGGFFPLVKKDPHKYIYPCQKSVKNWLKKAREQKKFLFVMTSSYVDFAEFSLNHVLGPDWKSYFDLFIMNARKPGWFFHNRPFLRIDGHSEKEPIQLKNMKQGEIYSQGNQSDFMKFLSIETDQENPKVLFFGDSSRSDIYPSKHYANWETVLILEEMGADHVEHPLAYTKDEEVEGEPAAKRKKKKVPTATLR